MNLKLFYWDDVDSLEDWAPGYAFALAESKEQAVELICNSEIEHGFPDERLRLELNNREPRIVTEPEGFAIGGGS